MSAAADKVLARLTARGGFDSFELYSEEASSLAIEAKNGEIDSFKQAKAKGLALRVLSAQRLGFAYATDLSEAALERLTDEALAAARETTADPHLGFPEAPAGLPEVDVFDPKMAEFALAEKLERARELEAATLRVDPRLKKVRRASYRESSFRLRIINSRGLDLAQAGTVASASVMAMAEENGAQESGWDFDFSRTYEGLDVARVGERAAGRALAKLGGRPLSSQCLVAVLDNLVAAELLEVVAASLIAENVEKGKSLFRGKQGQQVAAPVVTLIDDGLYPGGLATGPFDGEGSPRQKTALIEAGVLQGFLYDQRSAKRGGTRSTGNASRPSVLSPPTPNISNLYLAPGTLSHEELLTRMGRGLLVTEVLGAHTANPVSGDFSLGAIGIWVEGGQPAYPVKGFAISGNVVELLGRVTAVGGDLRFYGQVGAPSLLIDCLEVGGE